MVDNPRFDSFSLDLLKQTPDCPVRNAVPSNRSIFTKKSMKRFLGTGGFEVVLDWRYGLDFYNFIHTIALKVPELVGSTPYQFLFDHFDEFQHIFDQHDYNDGLFFIAQLKDY